MKNETTIFAPATAVSESSLTVIRISGPQTFSIISGIFSTSDKEISYLDVVNTETHKAIHGYIIDEREVIDEVVLTIFKAPHSFTGEDVAEISSHGGFYVYQRLSKLLFDHGLKFAEPGEYSKRAFLNGKMDLAQAEAVADIIRARTYLAHKAALKQLSGDFSKEVRSLKQDLLNYCSLIELEIDFIEDDVELVDKNVLISRLDNIIHKIDNMTKTYESGRLIKDGINIAIVGKPNVGKSSIFNYLLEENRAIVSELPGTTRDYLKEKFILGGYAFNLVDTAGIHDSIDIIEREGIKRSFEKITEADIILEVLSLDNTEHLEGHFEDSEHYIKVLNKSDLADVCPDNELCVSALNGHNMNVLRDNILSKAHNLIYKYDLTDNIITNERHRNKLLISCEYLLNVRNLILNGEGNELISIEIRSAMDELSEIIGQTSNVDILNNIFSSFCIGK